MSPPEPPERRIARLERMNAALIARVDELDAARSSTHALARTAAMLEQEVLARNADLEQALAALSQINAELASARETAEEANRAKSRFLRAASHDLLQPLSAAKLFLSHLGETAAGPVERDLIARIGANFDSAEELIRVLLEIARLDSQRLEIHRAPVALGRLFQRLAIDMQAQAEGFDLRFVPTRLVVESDPVLLRRVAQNLISNALKYTLRGRVLVGARRQGGSVLLEVHDTGPGIAPEDQGRIFNEFERLSRLDVPGTGLGLSIVQRACAQLGHDIGISSRIGTGSVFRIRLPRREAVTPAAPVPADPRPVPLGLAQRQALVVENDASMRQALVFLLRSWGMEVRDAASTRAALALVAGDALPLDLILTDYRLDGDDTGVQAIAALRQALAAPVPALIVSGESAATIGRVSAHLGAAVLEKPVAVLELRETVARLVGAAA